METEYKYRESCVVSEDLCNCVYHAKCLVLKKGRCIFFKVIVC